MNARWRQGASLVTLVLIASLAQACDDACYDCGPCGGGGPNETDGVGAYEVGTDALRTATVVIERWEEGECPGTASHVLWMQYENGTLTVEPAPADQELDSASPSSTGDGFATYQVGGAIVTVERDQHDEVRVSFSDGSDTVAATCVLSGEDAIACAID